MNYQNKYLKYKKKYLDLKNQIAGSISKEEAKKLTSKALYDVFIQDRGENFELIKHLPEEFPKLFGFIKGRGRRGNFKTTELSGKNIFKSGANDACNKENIFDINNPTWCYLFVFDLNQGINKLSNIYDKINDNTLPEEQLIANINKRFQIMLGLNLYWDNGQSNDYEDFYIININNPSDLFRPCYDREINDDKCLTLQDFNSKKAELKLKDPNLENYLNWINKFRIESTFPFTGLGYTYDFKNPRNILEEEVTDRIIGLDELIVKPNTNVELKGVLTISDVIKIIIANKKSSSPLSSEELIKKILELPLDIPK